MKAMEFLEECTTARLERAFVEHLDTLWVSGLDAWHQGLIKLQLMLMRQNQREGKQKIQYQPKTVFISVHLVGWKM